MIFYFTGTGNSKWIAEQTAAALGDKVCNIMDTNPETYHFDEKEIKETK